ncbi:MAG: pentapeptide repeat-containing protein [Rhizobiaceae bacterium]|nr:pentapeptide repeat-containing protein [Rhizobiaceae bacterium]
MPRLQTGAHAALMTAAALSAFFGLTMGASAGCNSKAAAEVDWSDCRKRNLIMSGSTLTNANIEGADLTSTDLRDSNLDGANLTKADLSRTYLSGSSLVGADFSRAVAYRALLDKTDLTDAQFEKSEMLRADFTDAIFRNTDFAKAELGRALFVGVKMDDVLFSYSNLARADFRGAKTLGSVDFNNSFLYRTSFEGVDLSKATGLVQSQLDISCGNSETLLPEGLVQPADWPCQTDD